MDREIPIIPDEYVEREFGTGAVKITPAHDPNDFEVAVRHDLPWICVIDEKGIMNENAGKYAGMDRYQARKAVVRDLTRLGLIDKIEDLKHNVGHCYRCGTVIEPLISKQWFVKMKPLAKPAIRAVKDGRIKFVPERFEKIYLNWMENIRDWCISRQLWWGHRIPAYYCRDCGETIVDYHMPESCSACGGTTLNRMRMCWTPGSALRYGLFQPLAGPIRPGISNTFPTSVLVTGYDIIFFWVARMIFSGWNTWAKYRLNMCLFTVLSGILRDER